ncbi:type II toxin-antitoxin system prevent-host-death family antitoxin [Aminobacter anthyllidis]|uniref:type II toxin-antitoxin system Phd/YefM family antitoxin n=1 Tax=Aminobacter anthyllidis TaxID=1035067 RepID=UPI0024580531|nr:type II toxin-antitoxin system prevent-host-death family antitoxin [Aminobacter anthyllidis]MDH4985934.1 type II toxin-antitoxin system prevent-host-death family antitoxin [Aminobacter anthyllidis]
MTYVTLTELRANMAKHLDKVEADRTELIVTRQNHEPVVMLPLSEWEGMKETLYLLSNPVNAERLLKSIEDANAGKLEEHELFEP